MLLVSIFAGRILGFRTESLTSLSFGILLIIVALIAISFFIHLWSWVALLFVIKDREENIGIRESYRRSWSSIIPYLWVSILSGFITMVGFVFLFIPGLIFLIWFSFASYVLVCENKKGWTALAASKEYIRGSWWRVVWRFVFVALVAWLFLYLLNTISNLTSVSGNNAIFSYLNYAFLTPMVTIYSFLIYENLKKINSVDSAVQNLELKK